MTLLTGNHVHRLHDLKEVYDELIGDLNYKYIGMVCIEKKTGQEYLIGNVGIKDLRHDDIEENTTISLLSLVKRNDGYYVRTSTVNNVSLITFNHSFKCTGAREETA